MSESGANADTKHFCLCSNTTAALPDPLMQRTVDVMLITCTVKVPLLTEQVII